jgi:cyanophycin synthetase
LEQSEHVKKGVNNMDVTRQINFRVFAGPNLRVPFAAVVAEFPALYANSLPAAVAIRIAEDLIPMDGGPAYNILRDDVTLPALSAALAVAWIDLRGPNDLPMQVEPLPDGRWQIALGYHDVDTALTALQLGIEQANSVFTRAAGAVANTARIRALAQRIHALTVTDQPGSITRALFRVARRNDIPFCSIAPGAQIWMYGQGARGIRFSGPVSEHESFLGVRLSKDKILTNRLLHRLGLPGSEFGVANTIELARNIARNLGYPVVAKPSDRGMGNGITLDIENDAALDTAFALAQSAANNGAVILERQYAGNHHRISVFGGKFKRATEITGAHVVGDGFRTVEALIAAENETRTIADVRAGFVKRLKVDTEMIDHLAKQGYGLADRLPAGVKLQLRMTSNVAAGGRSRDVSAIIHPDNIAMAEAIARNFWLDAVGIDFVTPDISKSWQEIRSAVVDVNSHPGVSSDFLAEKVLGEKFPPGQNGRIPGVLILGGDDDLLRAVAEAIAANGLKVGRTDGSSTYLGADKRHIKAADLALRVMSLLLDPACEALVVNCTAADLEGHGIPHSRFDLAVIAPQAEISRPVLDLLLANVRNLIELELGQKDDPRLAANIADLARR